MALVHPETIPEVVVPKMRSGRYYYSSDNPDLHTAQQALPPPPSGSWESGVLPYGFWFSVGGHLFQMEPWSIRRYFYEVQLSKPSKPGMGCVKTGGIQVLSRLNDIKHFTRYNNRNNLVETDWEKVKREYDGLIVSYYPSLRPVPPWYNALGCPRGVVWRHLEEVKLRRLSRPPTALGIVPHPEIGEGEEV